MDEPLVCANRRILYSGPDTGEKIFRKVLAVASGEKTKSEEQGYGENEVCAVGYRRDYVKLKERRKRISTSRMLK
jgi:hypothetical protein